MANFPNSVYTPASKSAGQTIGASFYNDPDAEITAIEDGLINGTAPIASSNLNIRGVLKLAGSAGSSGQALISQGGSSNPTWGSPWSSLIGAIPTVLAKSTNYTVASTDGTDYGGVTIEFTGTGLSTITLFPLASTSAGRVVRVKNMSGTSTSIVTVDANSTQLIDSTLTFTLAVEDAASFQANNDGTKWLVF